MLFPIKGIIGIGEQITLHVSSAKARQHCGEIRVLTQ